MKNVLIVNGHQPYPFSEGRLNASFVERAKQRLIEKGLDVRVTEVARDFDIEAEVESHQWADTVIMQFPINWMGAPWSLKKYMDEVYSAGMDGRLCSGDGRTAEAPILDLDPEAIENLSKVGFKTYYGDATRPDLLHSAGLEEAQLFVAAIDEPEKQLLLVEHVAKQYPHVRILARANDRHHLYELENAGAHVVERELFEGAMSLGKAALVELGAHPFKAETKARAFRSHDRGTVDTLRIKWNEGGVGNDYIEAMRRRSEDLYEIMQSDRSERHDRSDRGWTPPPKGDAGV